MFQDILDHASRPRYVVSGILYADLLGPQQIQALKGYYEQRLQRAVQTRDSSLGFEALGILYNLKEYYSALSEEEITGIVQAVNTLVREGVLDFWLRPDKIETWSEALFLLDDLTVEPILIYAYRHGLSMGALDFGYLQNRAIDMKHWSPELRALLKQLVDAGVKHGTLAQQLQTHP